MLSFEVYLFSILLMALIVGLLVFVLLSCEWLFF